jgi:hypothetical protein
MDLKYYRKRLAVSLAEAKSAKDSTSRIAHEGMAKAYRLVLETVVAPVAGVTRKLWPASRDEQLRDALDKWEDEGGGSR